MNQQVQKGLESLELLHDIISSLKRVRVLLVEDSPGDAALTMCELEKYPADVVWKRDVDGAIAALGDSRFDMVLLDLRLGQRSGLDVLRGTDTRLTRFLVMTGIPEESPEVSEALELGAILAFSKSRMSENFGAIFRAAR